MPGMDKTGPNGQGSQTGRQRGVCGSNSNNGSSRRGRGCGMGRRNGFGNRFGFGNNQSVQQNQLDDLSYWEAEKNSLLRSLEAIEARIGQFKKPE